jgi:hypothetical protein
MPSQIPQYFTSFFDLVNRLVRIKFKNYEKVRGFIRNFESHIFASYSTSYCNLKIRSTNQPEKTSKQRTVETKC